MPLSPKQQAFVDEYLIDLNATQAAIRAGYSAKTAQEQSSRLLSNVIVAEAVRVAMEQRSQKTGIDAEWLLKRLADEATADLLDLYDENGHLRPVAEWPLIWRQGLVAGIETLREKVGEGEDGEPEFATVQKIKLSDRVKRLELIGKHVDVQAFQERLNVDVRVGLAVVLDEARQRLRNGV